VWKGPGKEDSVELTGLGDKKWVWKGPGTDTDPLEGLVAQKVKWHRQPTEANVLSYLPTTIPDAGEKA